MPFDPTQMADETTFEGHLEHEPMSEVIATILRTKATGRLCVRDEAGPNYLFFMQGKPVGVVLSQVLHPLGQLLLELGKVDSAQFVKAQRLIGDGERLPGQVFIEIGAISEAELKETLATQARRKAQRFAGFQNLSYDFAKGLSFLTGFKSSPMEGPPLVFHAIGATMDGAARRKYLADFGPKVVRATSTNLGAPLESFGFGRAEERFLSRMNEFHTISELDQFGTLPADDIAGLLRYMQLLGVLEVSEQKPAPPPPAPPPRTATPAPNSQPRAAPVQKAAPARRPKPKAPDSSYGPSPNSAVQVTGARDIGDKRGEEKSLPSVMIDYDSLGIGPHKR